MVKSRRKFGSMRDRGREEAKGRGGQGGGSGTLNLPEGVDVEFFKPKKGNYLLDIIPYIVTNNPNPFAVKGDLFYKRGIWTHFNTGPENKVYLCPKTHGSNKRCPICEEHAKLKKDVDADEKEVAALKAKERMLLNIIDLNDEDKGIQLWEISYYNFGEQLDEEIIATEDEPKYFADLENGLSVSVRFKDTQIGNGPVFQKASKVDFKDRENYDEDILEKVFDLDGILKVLSYDALEKVHLGEEDDDENSDDKDEPPTDESDEKTESTKADECPEGGEWGKDFDEWDECDTCDVRDVCEEEQTRMKKEAKKPSTRSARKPTKKDR